jgi:DNA-binding Lrp family transcriptional regulator
VGDAIRVARGELQHVHDDHDRYCRAEVSRPRAGLGLTVFIGLKVEGQSQETASRVEQALLAIPAVVACYLVSGSYDFLAEVAVPDLAGCGGCCWARS